MDGIFALFGAQANRTCGNLKGFEVPEIPLSHVFSDKKEVASSAGNYTCVSALCSRAKCLNVHTLQHTRSQMAHFFEVYQNIKPYSMLQRVNFSLLLAFTMLMLSSCDLVGGIFKAGLWAGIIIVIIVVVLIIWIIRKIL